MIKRNWVYLLFAFAVALFVITRFTGNAQQHADKVKISVKTFHTELGWGYDVYADNTVYIHQESIPALEGRKGFATEKEAFTIARLVMAKMSYSKFPVISPEELDSCGITR